MKGIFRGKWRLNRLGKLTVGLLILLSISLYFYLNHSQSNNYVAAVNNEKIIAQNKQKVERQSDTPEYVINKGNAVVEEHAKESKNDSIVEENHEGEDSQGDEIQKEEIEKEEPKDRVSEESIPNDQNSHLQLGKVVYLTFDDGPNVASKDILQLLKKYNAKATFFMLEPNMKDYPDAVKMMVNEGHTVGVHGVSHNVAQVYKSPASFVGEMETAIERIEELTSVKTRLIRAPFGSKPYITPPFKAAIDQTDMIMWDWNIDSIDWKLTNGEYVQKVISQINESVNKVPLIVLMHEKQSTANHLEKLLIYLTNNGYAMEAIKEAMEPIQFK